MFDPDTAREAMRETLTYNMPDNEDYALDLCRDSLNEYIDLRLTYTRDVIEMWNWETNENINLGDYAEISEAISASVFFQLTEEYDYLTLDALDAFILEYLNLQDEDGQANEEMTWAEVLEGFESSGTIDRDTALELIAEVYAQ